MIFSKKKSGSDTEPAAPRGRGGAGGRGANALARRFLVDDEPDTIDLSTSDSFTPAATEPPTEPETRVGFTPTPGDGAGSGVTQLVSRDDVTGKFHVHPGNAAQPVLLGEEEVIAATELRPGDRIRVGGAEFEFLG